MIERPIGFTIAERRFYIYPVTLGVLTLIQEVTESIKLNTQYLQINPMVEMLRITEQHKDLACRIIAYTTCNGKEVFEEDKISERVDFFMANMEEEDIASLLLTILTADKSAQVMKQLDIDKEMERMRKVSQKQDNKHSVSFGGMSIYGTLIDPACERYGWTYDYVLWGISYMNLRLMLSDKISNMYLTDDELKKCKGLLTSKKNSVSAESKEGRELIKSMKWD